MVANPNEALNVDYCEIPKVLLFALGLSSINYFFCKELIPELILKDQNINFELLDLLSLFSSFSIFFTLTSFVYLEYCLTQRPTQPARPLNIPMNV